MLESREDFGNRVLDFIDEMRNVEDHAEICRRMTREINLLGYSFVTVWNMPKLGDSIRNCFLFNSRPREYSEQYAKNNYIAIDPLVRAVRQTLQPVAWSDIPVTAISKEAAKIFHEAHESGANNGFVVPIVTASGSISIFSASGDQPDVSKRARSAMEIVGIYSHQLLQRAARASRHEPLPQPILTKREREIMTWVAAGKTDDEIAAILNIQRETVTTHVNNSKSKLNSTRRTHAVVQALRLGEIAI